MSPFSLSSIINLLVLHPETQDRLIDCPLLSRERITKWQTVTRTQHLHWSHFSNKHPFAVIEPRPQSEERQQQRTCILIKLVTNPRRTNRRIAMIQQERRNGFHPHKRPLEGRDCFFFAASLGTRRENTEKNARVAFGDTRPHVGVYVNSFSSIVDIDKMSTDALKYPNSILTYGSMDVSSVDSRRYFISRKNTTREQLARSRSVCSF